MTDPNHTARMSEGLALLSELHNRKLTDRVLAFYFRELRHLTPEQFDHAVRESGVHDRFFPNPGRLLELAGVGMASEAEDAWLAIVDAARHGDTLELSDDTAREALRRVGGFRAVSLADEIRDVPHLRRRFVEAFADLRSRPEPPALPEETAEASDPWTARHPENGRAVRILDGSLWNDFGAIESERGYGWRYADDPPTPDELANRRGS